MSHSRFLRLAGRRYVRRTPGGANAYHGRNGDDGMSPVMVQGELLRRFVDALLQAMGANAEAAAEVATHLVRANLSGHDAHGVARLPAYLAQIDRGELLPAARPRLVRETGVVAVVDGGRGFGQHATAVALDWCLARAPVSGLAAAAVRGCTDVGRLGEYAERAAEAGMVAVATAGVAGPGAGETTLYGGRERFFGANPWSFSAAGRTHRLMVDATTSSVSLAEVLLARAKGEGLPSDCVYDRFGRPSNDPDDLAAGGLVPLGGAVAGHKGLGLAFASALLGGLAGGGPPLGGVFVQAIDPAAFGDAGAYGSLVDETVAAAKAMRPRAGRSEVALPGEAEARARAERGRAGIRLPEATWMALAAVASRFEVPLPELGAA